MISFPKNEPILEVWKEFTKQCFSNVKPRSLVCSAHFTPDCFEHYLRKIRLKLFAVSTIVVQRVKGVW